MKQLALASTLTALLAVTGFYLGLTIHDNHLAALVPSIASALGGFGIACAALDVHARWKCTRKPLGNC
jgi:hypothetical protein